MKNNIKTNDEYVNEPSNATQCSNILAHLRAGNTITQIEALNKFKCFRLASRICDLKKRIAPYEKIEVKKILTPTGKYVAQYKLIRKLNDEAPVC